jgi:hypothetical protein
MSEPGESELRQRLRALRVDPPDGGFTAKLHRGVVSAGPPHAPPWWRRLPVDRRVGWPALAAAAALAAVAVFTGTRPHPAPAAAELPATKVAVVRLNLSADVAVDKATIAVHLPDGLVFWSDGRALEQRSFEWTQPLQKGDNEIPIAVRGSRPGRYRVSVTAWIGSQRIEDDVVLQVVEG